MLTEGRGVPIGVAVDGANCHAMNLVRATIERIVVARPAPTEEQPQGMCLDKGYNDDEVRATVREFGFTAHIRRCGEEAKEIAREAGKRARHWAVPRRQRRLNRSHRLLIRWEKKPERAIRKPDLWYHDSDHAVLMRSNLVCHDVHFDPIQPSMRPI